MSCVESLNFFYLDMNAAPPVRACGHSLRFMRHAPFPGIHRSVGGDGLWETSLDASLKIPSQNLGGMMGQGRTFGFMDALSVTIPKTLTTAALLEMVPQFVICTICHCIVTGVSDHLCTAYLHRIIE